MRTEMTRYNADKCNRKNTLVTLREGDVIYFGIARCNATVGDVFKKSHGRMIAKARAIRAKLEFAVTNEENTFSLHESNLRGFVLKEKIADLLKYFDNIDSIMKSAL